MGSQQMTTLIVTLILAVLVYLFSQRQKLYELFKPKKLSAAAPVRPAARAVIEANIDLLSDLTGAALRCRRLASEIGAGFKLAELYRLLEKSDWPHPHLTIRSLRENGLLVPAGEGLFDWNISDRSGD
ncbi:MAG: hypothetical protein HZB24_09895 [Desulfobacterales bacterium]|nr:hypothetical protein [Desulfobacterales bacterium]